MHIKERTGGQGVGKGCARVEEAAMSYREKGKKDGGEEERKEERGTPRVRRQKRACASRKMRH